MNYDVGSVAVLDLEPASSDFLGEVLAGLSGSPRTLPCKFFYDERGAELFQKICELPEYYITRAETQILARYGHEMAAALAPNCELIGFGTGAGIKTRMLLEELENPIAYVPVDISKQRLFESAEELSRAMPALEILPVCADYLQELRLPTPSRRPDRTAVYFPGSTIGNLEPEPARAFLERVARLCAPHGGMLIGVDLKKSPGIIEPAYNDGAGVTAAFNLNLLVRANRELGANFRLSRWRHRAVFNSEESRIEMYLISDTEQAVRIADREFHFAAGEKITTEFSYKHSRESFIKMAAAAGFEFRRLWTDDEGLFGVFHFRVRP